MPLAEAVEWIGGGERDEGRRVALTFDDGYRSFHRDLWPLLRKYRAPAALFVVSGFIGTDRLLWWDLIEVLVARAHVREVDLRGQRWPVDFETLAADPLVTIGGHTCTHPILTRVPPEVARQEIERGKAILERELQRPVRFFAYPNGRASDFDETHAAQLRAAGFECAVSTVEGVCERGADPMRLPRKNMSGQFTNAALACKLTGLWLQAG